MKHGHEESDLAIVAGKPANKAEWSAAEQSADGPTAAELVEPRAGTKGNVDQQSTCRAQSRGKRDTGAGTHTQAVRERRNERLTGLFHHITAELLEEAFYQLKQDAAPGVDRLMWKDYE